MAVSFLTINALYLIDSRLSLADRDRLIAGLPVDSAWALLDDEQDGLSQIRDIVAGYSGLGSLHLIGHGAPGSLLLGSSEINLAVINQHAAELAQIGQSLNPNGDILLYGCNVAHGEVGQAYIEQLARLTQADVAASTDQIGAQGDWVLEAATGTIEATALNISGFETTLDTIGITSLRTTNRKPTLSGSVALGVGRTLEIELGGKVYKVGPQLTISGNTWTLNLGGEASDLALGSHDVKARVVDAKPAAPVEVSLNANTAYAVNYITGTSGNDTITGSNTQADVAILNGNRSDYSISATSSGVTITDKRTGGLAQGTDRLTNLNLIKFADSQAPEFVLGAASRQALTGTESSHTIAVDASKLYNGTKAAETFVVGKNVSAMILARSGDTVDLSGRITDYTYTAKGTQLQINDGTYTTTVNIGGAVTLRTASGSYGVTCSYSAGTPSITLGGQIVNGSLNLATAKTSSATVSSNAQTIDSTTTAGALVISTTVGDSTPPVVTAVTDATTASVTNAPISFTVTFSEALATEPTTANFTATNGTVTSVTKADSMHYVLVVTPTPGLASGNVSLGLVAGSLADEAGNQMVDANLASFDTQGVDTVAPGAANITAGSSNWYQIVGTAPAGCTVTIIKGGTPDTVLGTCIADVNGVFVYPLVTSIAAGTVSFKAQASDAAGNQSAVSAGVNVTIAAVPNLSGLSAADIANYTDAQIRLMSVTGVGATQFGATTKDGHLLTQALSPSQVAQLNQTQFNALTLAQYQGLNGAGLTPTQINQWGIGTTQTNAYGVTSRWVDDLLTDAQISALTPTTISGLIFSYDPLQTDARFALLSQSQVQALTSAQLTYIFMYSTGNAGLNASYLTTTQVAGLTSLAGLSATQFAQVLPNLSPAQISTLSITQLNGLTDTQLLQVLPNLVQGQIAGLSTAKLLQVMPSLSATQTGWVSYYQIHALTSSQVQGLNGAGLTSYQVQSCSTNDGNNLIVSLTNSQVSALPIATIQGLSFIGVGTAFTPDQVAHLTQAQTQALTKVQFDKLYYYSYSSFQAINAAFLSAQQLNFGYATTGLLVSNLSNSQVASLSLSQIAALTDATTRGLSAGGLTATQLTYQNADGHTILSLLTPSQVATLGNSIVLQVISSLSALQISGLTSGQFASLSNAQVQSLNGAGFTASQINNAASASGTPLYKLLSPTQMDNLSVATIQGIYFSRHKFTAAQFAVLDQAQIQSLSLSQLNDINMDSIDAFNAINASYFSSEQLGYNLPYGAWGGPLVKMLNPAQVAQLTNAQFSSISPTHFKTMYGLKGLSSSDLDLRLSDNTTVFSNLTNLQLMVLTKEVIGSLTAAQIHTLSGVVPGRDSFGQIIPGQLNFLDAGGFTEAQLEFTDKDNNKLLSILDDSQLRDLNANTIAAMTAAQIATLSDAKISCLNVAGLSAAKLAWIDGSGHTVLSALSGMQIASLSAEQIGQLTSAQIKSLTPSQLQGFNSFQLGCTDAANNTVLSELSTSQIQQLSGTAISGLNSSQFAYVSEIVNQSLGVNNSNYAYSAVKNYVLNNIASLIAPSTAWSTAIANNDWSLSTNFNNAVKNYYNSVRAADSVNTGLISLLETIMPNGVVPWIYDPSKAQGAFTVAECYAKFVQYVKDAFAPTDSLLGRLGSNANFIAVNEQLNDPYSYMSVLNTLEALQANVSGSGLSSGQKTTLSDLYKNVASVKGVSSYVATILKHLVDTSTVGQTQISFQEQVNKWFLGTDNPSPALATGVTMPYIYKGDAPLYPAPDSGYQNVSQGSLGDCYLISSFIEIILQTPEKLSSIISANPNGTYAVKFFVPDVGIEYITVDGYVADNLAYSRDGTAWVSLLEKAFATARLQILGSEWGGTANAYQTIQAGNTEGIVYFTGNNMTGIFDNPITLNGVATTEFASLYQSGNATYATIKNALDGGKYVLFSSEFDGAAWGGNNSWLVAQHMYAVVGTNPTNGHFLIMNPWGGTAANNYNIHELDVVDLARVERATGKYNGFSILSDNPTLLFDTPLTVTSGQMAGMTIVGGTYAVSDGSVNISSNLDSLYQNASRITSINISDGGSINLSADQMVAKANLFPLVSSDVDVSSGDVSISISSSASTVRFEALTGWGIGDTLIYSGSSLAPLVDKASAQAGVAAVTNGVATFNSADDTLGEMIVAAEAAINSLSSPAGAFVKWAYQGSAYVFISDGLSAANGTTAEHDTLIKLVNVADLSHVAYDSTTHTIIGG